MEETREQLLKKNVPTIFCNMISHWTAVSWTPQTLPEIFRNTNLQWRIGKREMEGVQWETGCCYEEATAEQFLHWQDPMTEIAPENPLAGYNSATYWCYADYKYMAKLFAERPEILKAVDWSNFGFEGRDGTQSTFWLGSKGAYTPCHYDTYGCNLVAQIYGRKRWILFPPEDTPYLYPTRVPYEESSVFSEVDIKTPDLKTHVKFKKSHPYIVTLEPGQVLFVPRNWWHFVESLDTSISINSWIELDTDDHVRLNEAIARMLVTTLIIQDGSVGLDEWLNPTEDLTPHDVNMEYISQALAAFSTKKSEAVISKQPSKTLPESVHEKSANQDELAHPPDAKKPRLTEDCQCPIEAHTYQCQLAKNSIDIKQVSFTHYIQLIAAARESEDKSALAGPEAKRQRLSEQEAPTSRVYPELAAEKRRESIDVRGATSSDIDIRTVVKCVTHPAVISMICQILQEKVLKSES